MGRKLMTCAELDAFERRWKTVVLVFGVALVVDLACLATHPSGLVRFACWLIAIASVLACAYGLRKLRNGGHAQAIGDDHGYSDALDPSEIVSSLTDLADHD